MSRVITEPEQEEKAKERNRSARDQELDDVRGILSSQGGRRFIARLLSYCGVSRSTWHPSAAIHKFAGIQEVGHHILSEVVAADPKAGATMLVEAYASELNTSKRKG